MSQPIFIEHRSSKHETRTYPLVPLIPELRDAKVETDAECERAGEDRRDENTCRDWSTQAWFVSLPKLTVSPDKGVVERIGHLYVDIS